MNAKYLKKSQGVIFITHFILSLMAMMFVTAALTMANTSFMEKVKALYPLKRENVALQLCAVTEAWLYDEIISGNIPAPPKRGSVIIPNNAPVFYLPEAKIAILQKNNPDFYLEAYVVDEHYYVAETILQMQDAVYYEPRFFDEDEPDGIVSDLKYLICVFTAHPQSSESVLKYLREIRVCRKSNGILVKMPLYSGKKLLTKDK